MKLLFIETGRPPLDFGDSFGLYPEMLRQKLEPLLENAEFFTCSVLNGESLPDLNTIDGIITLGSPYGVYDDVPWIKTLEEYIKTAAEMKKPQVGICFGHQLIAQAMGGKVMKAPQGWGIGRHTYEFMPTESFKTICPKSLNYKINLLVSHQDQVLEKPESAKIIAKSDFTPFAALHYENEKILSFQAHPEFSPEFSSALIESRKGTRFSHEEADNALKTLSEPINSDIAVNMIAEHLKAN